MGRWGRFRGTRGLGFKGHRSDVPDNRTRAEEPRARGRSRSVGGPRGVGGAGLLPELETKPRCLGQSSDARGRARPRSRVAARSSECPPAIVRAVAQLLGSVGGDEGYTRTVRGGTDGLVWEVPYGSPTGGDRVDTREPSTTPSIQRLAAVDRTGVSDAADARVATVRDRCEGTPAVCSGFEYLHW